MKNLFKYVLTVMTLLMLFSFSFESRIYAHELGGAVVLIESEPEINRITSNYDLQLQPPTEDTYSIQNNQRLNEIAHPMLGGGSLVRMSSGQARRFTQANKTNEHQFKADFVGKNNVSRFDIYYTKKNNAVYLVNKNGKVVHSTGYHFTKP